MLATCFLLSSRTELSACCAMHTSLKVSKPLGKSVRNLHTKRSNSLLRTNALSGHLQSGETSRVCVACGQALLDLAQSCCLQRMVAGKQYKGCRSWRRFCPLRASMQAILALLCMVRAASCHSLTQSLPAAQRCTMDICFHGAA